MQDIQELRKSLKQYVNIPSVREARTVLANIDSENEVIRKRLKERNQAILRAKSLAEKEGNNEWLKCLQFIESYKEQEAKEVEQSCLEF